MKVMIFDIDGTLANCEHRLHHVRKSKGEKKNYAAFEREMINDTLIDEVAMFYDLMVADDNIQVILLTGRGEKSRGDTEQWFLDNDLPLMPLIMKRHSHEPDVEFKSRMYDHIVEKYGEVIGIWEDRERVVKMWNERGVFVYDVAQNVKETT